MAKVSLHGGTPWAYSHRIVTVLLRNSTNLIEKEKLLLSVIYYGVPATYITMEAWVQHPHLRVFGNETDFKGKVDKFVKEVFSLLGEPVPLEIERKFLVTLPPMARLKTLGVISEVDIVQTYLKSVNDKVERRVRQRGTKENGFTFFYTEKYSAKDKDGNVYARYEKEEKISERQYLNYLLEADTSLHQIVKKRICFVYEKQFFELDIYPCEPYKAILEIEVNSLDIPVFIPPMLTGHKEPVEVTDNPAYKNYNLAKKMPCKGFLDFEDNLGRCG